MNIRHMLQGWGNMIIPSEAVTEESERRFKICDPCPVRTGIICDAAKGGCNCVLVAKTKSDSKCPKNKW